METFFISGEAIEHATNIIGEKMINKTDIYTLATLTQTLAKKDFINSLYTEFCTAVDNGYNGRIFDFVRYCISTLIKGINLIKYLLNTANDEIKKTLNRLHYHAQKNLTALKNELNKIQVFQELAPPSGATEKNNTKAKIIMLDKIGMLKTLHDYTQQNTTQTAQILSEIMNIKAETIRTSIRPILAPYNDENNANSPYFCKKNIENANAMLKGVNI